MTKIPCTLLSASLLSSLLSSVAFADAECRKKKWWMNPDANLLVVWSGGIEIVRVDDSQDIGFFVGEFIMEPVGAEVPFVVFDAKKAESSEIFRYLYTRRRGIPRDDFYDFVGRENVLLDTHLVKFNGETHHDFSSGAGELGVLARNWGMIHGNTFTFKFSTPGVKFEPVCLSVSPSGSR